MGESPAAVVLERVSKRFLRAGGAVDALRDVSLELRRGELALLVGDNGAGKTTLLRVLAGLVDADAGEVRVHGREIRRERESIQRGLGWCSSDERSAYPRLSGRENLRLFAALHGLDRRSTDRRIAELDPVLGLRDLLDVPFQACSSGQRQRLAIARALIHEPDLLLFDEPERSLDAPTRAAFAAHLRKIAIEDGRIVVVAGHELGDLEGPGSRRVRLRDGRVEADEGPTAAHPLPARERGNAARPLPGALRALRALARRDRLVFLSYRSQVGLRLGLVTAWILILYYVSQLVDTASPKVAPYLAGDYFSFALLGLAFLRIAQVSLVQMASALREEQLQGTVEPLFATGTKPILLVIGGLLWPLSSEMAGIVLVFGTGALVLGAHAADPAVPALLVASAATIVATAVWGVLSVAFVVAFQRGDPVALLVNLITIGLSGAYFPVEMVPAWLRPVSSVLPLRWGLDAVRAAALRGEGFGSPAYRRALANLAFLAAILLPVALWSFGAAVRRARRRGTLAQS